VAATVFGSVGRERVNVSPSRKVRLIVKSAHRED